MSAYELQNVVFSLNDVQDLILKEIKLLQSPWLMERSTSLLYGPAGIGKTWWTMSLLNKISKGEDFGPWSGNGERIICLYMDAEMPLVTVRKRAAALGFSENCLLYSNQYAGSKGKASVNLLSKEWRDAFTNVLTFHDVRVWVLDNLSCSTPGVDENSTQEWSIINNWLLELKMIGISTIIVHHPGKNGEQRGASSREGNVDTMIKLKRIPGHKIENGCKFQVEFQKTRSEHPEQLCTTTWSLELDHPNLWNWKCELEPIHKVKKITLSEQIDKMIDEGCSNDDILEHVQGSKQSLISQRRKLFTGKK